MKNTMIMKLAAMVAVVAITATVQAVPVSGGIGFSGAFVASGALNSPNVAISFPDPVLVNTRSGSFTSVAIGSLVTMTSGLQGNPAAILVNPLWTVGGFIFTLNSIAQKDVGPTTITFFGDGIITGNGFTATAGSWLATFNSLGQGTLTFSSSSVAAPDGGTTVMLLGAALSGLCLLRKKMVA